MEIFFKYAMVVLLILNYLYVAYGLWFQGEKNNFVTWALWTAFDSIGLYGTLKKGEDPTLLITFVSGSAIIALILLIKREIIWTWVEFVILVLVGACIYISQTQSPAVTIVATALGLTLSGVPYWKDLYKAKFIKQSQKISAYGFLLALSCGVIKTLLVHEFVIIPLNGVVYWVVAIIIMKMPRKIAH